MSDNIIEDTIVDNNHFYLGDFAFLIIENDELIIEDWDQYAERIFDKFSIGWESTSRDFQYDKMMYVLEYVFSKKEQSRNRYRMDVANMLVN